MIRTVPNATKQAVLLDAELHYARAQLFIIQQEDP